MRRLPFATIKALGRFAICFGERISYRGNTPARCASHARLNIRQKTMLIGNRRRGEYIDNHRAAWLAAARRLSASLSFVLLAPASAQHDRE